VTLTASDRLDILDLLARADSAATRRDAEAYVRLFTDGAVLDGVKGEESGKDALRRGVDLVWRAEGPESVHLTLNAVTDAIEGDPDRAVATSKLLILRGSDLTIAGVWTIIHHVVRLEGQWLVERRTVAAG
jgi:ketosteroid isomerase-like protein